MTAAEELDALARHALNVLRNFPKGTLTPTEVDRLAVAALTAIGYPIPEWRVPQ